MFKRSGIIQFGRNRTAVENVHHTCQVEFLDGSEPLSVTYQKDTEGQYLIDHVCNNLDLIEKDYFGLSYLDGNKQKRWIDAKKSIYKQLKGVYAPLLSFQVKFYPSDPLKLKEEITRYQIFLQLKRDLYNGWLRCTDDDSNVLAAYIVQSELGDFDVDEHLPNYIEEVKCLPRLTTLQTHSIGSIHKTLVGQVPSEAEANFLKTACSLEWYGVEPFTVSDLKGDSVILGINHRGLSIFNNNSCTQLFRWTQIRRFECDGRTFIIRLTNLENDDSSLLMKKKKPACAFKCRSTSSCQLLWKSAVEQQYFFTLHFAAEAPKVTSSGGLFHRGSKFRFSGRCEHEVRTSSADIDRKEPNFTRSASNAEFARRYNSLRSSTLPSQWKPNGSRESSEDHGIVVMETSLDDSFPSSSGPLKDEVNQSVVAEEPMIIHVDADEKSMLVGSGLNNGHVTPSEEYKSTVELSDVTADESTSPLPFVIGGEMTSESDGQLNVTDTELRHRHVTSADTHDVSCNDAIVDDVGVTRVSPRSSRCSRCFKNLLRLLFVSLLLVAAFIGIVLETELDYAFVSDVRAMPEVQQLSNEYYWPMRHVVVQQVNEIMQYAGW